MKQNAEQTDLQEVFQGTATCFLVLEEVQAPCLITLENAFELCTSRRPEPETLKVLFGPFFFWPIHTNQYLCYEQNTPIMKDSAPPKQTVTPNGHQQNCSRLNMK